MQPLGQSNINPTDINRANAVIHALAHPVRMEIINKLRSEADVNVSKLVAHLDMDSSAVSVHLRILLRANLVDRRRQHRLAFYTVNEDNLRVAVVAVVAIR